MAYAVIVVETVKKSGAVSAREINRGHESETAAQEFISSRKWKTNSPKVVSYSNDEELSSKIGSYTYNPPSKNAEQEKIEYEKQKIRDREFREQEERRAAAAAQAAAPAQDPNQLPSRDSLTAAQRAQLSNADAAYASRNISRSTYQSLVKQIVQPDARAVGQTSSGTYNIPASGKSYGSSSNLGKTPRTGKEKAAELIQEFRKQVVDVKSLPPGSEVETASGRVPASSVRGNVEPSYSSLASESRRVVEQENLNRQKAEQEEYGKRRSSGPADGGSNNLGQSILPGEVRREETKTLYEKLYRKMEEAQQAASFREKTTLGKLKESSKAIFFGATSRLVLLTTKPKEYAKGVKDSLLHPIESTRQLGQDLREKPAATLGQGIGDFGIAKGISKGVKTVYKPGRAARVLENVEESKSKGTFPETIIVQGPEITTRGAQIKTTDIIVDSKRKFSVEKPSQLTTSAYEFDVVRPGVAAGRGKKGKITQSIVSSKDTQFVTLKIESKIGEPTFVRSVTEKGKTNTKVFKGDRLLKEFKGKADPEIVFTSPRTQIKGKGKLDMPELAFEAEKRITSQKGVSNIKGKKYKAKGEGFGIEKKTLATRTERRATRRVAQPVLDLDVGAAKLETKLIEVKQTRYRYVKYRPKEKPRKITRTEEGLIDIETPAKSKTVQRGFAKRVFKIGYEKASKNIRAPKKEVVVKVPKQFRQDKAPKKKTSKASKEQGAVTILDPRTLQAVDIQRPTSENLMSSSKFTIFSEAPQKTAKTKSSMAGPAFGMGKLRSYQDQLRGSDTRPRQRIVTETRQETKQRIKQAPIVSLRSRERIITQQKQETKPRMQQQERVSIISKERLITQPRQQQQRQVNIQLQSSLVGRPRGGRGITPQTRKSFPPDTPLVVFSKPKKEPKKKKIKDEGSFGMQRKGYNPSFAAGILKIKGKKEPELLTKSDLGVRPIIRRI